MLDSLLLSVISIDATKLAKQVVIPLLTSNL
jgi:hypothetical protein